MSYAPRSTRGSFRRALGLFLALLVLPTCRRDTSISTVLLLSVDTWRFDANAFLGNRKPTPTPFFDSLARRGIVMERAYAPVPMTGPSHFSMLTARWPWRDGVHLNGDRPEAPPRDTLASRLREAGFRTAGFVSCAVLDHRLGFAQGFDHYDDALSVAGGIGDIDMPRRLGEVTVKRALNYVQGQVPADSKLFLFAHLFDAHFPYPVPDSRFSGAHADYLSGVAAADAAAQALVSGLKQLGRDSASTLYVVTGDHGESLGDHGEPTHGLLLNSQTTRIPLFLAGAGIAPGRIPSLSSTVDIAPTILSLLKLDPNLSDGYDLLSSHPAQRRLPLASRFPASAFGLSPARGVRSGRWLLEFSPAPHLWNAKTDPDERRDLARERPDIVARLAPATPDVSAPTGSGVPSGVADGLRALGYAGGARQSAGTGDVRRFATEGSPLYEKLLTAEASGNTGQATFIANELLARYPDASAVWVEAGFAAASHDNFEEASESFDCALRLDPGNSQARENLAAALMKLHREAEAETELLALLAADPDSMTGLYNLAMLLVRSGRRLEAVPYGRRFLALYPHHPKHVTLRTLLGPTQRDAVRSNGLGSSRSTELE